MIEFFTRSTAQDDPRLQVIADELKVVRAMLEEHCKEHNDESVKLPEQLKAALESAIKSVGWGITMLAVKCVFEEFTKWAWRLGLGYLGLRLLEYAHTLAVAMPAGKPL